MSGQAVSQTTTALFSSRVLQLLRTHQTIVDLGAGSDGSARSPVGILSRYVRRVVAVDIEPCPGELPRNVEWRQERIEQWYQALFHFSYEPIHGFLLRNSVHFLDRGFVINELLPMLVDLVEPDGFIAISTFYQQPEPSVHTPFPSLFHLDELLPIVPANWVVVHAVEEIRIGPGLYDKVNRTWYTTQFVIKHQC